MFRLKLICVAAIVAVAGSALAQGKAEPVRLFQPGFARSGGMTLNSAAVDQLRRADTNSIKLEGVPLITGVLADFTLSPLPVFAPDAVITLMKDNGATEALQMPDIRTWYGTDAGNPSRALFLSADENGEVRVMVTGDRQTSVTVISPTQSGGDVYRIEPANIPATPFCDTNALENGMPASPKLDLTRGVPVDNTIYEIEMMIDVGHALHEQFEGDSNRILDHLVDLFGALNTIYQRDLKVRLSVVQLFIWDTPDPFDVNSVIDPAPEITTDDQLYNYRQYNITNRPGVARDLAHLLGRVDGQGGQAFLNVMGAGFETSRYGVSNVDGYATFPSDPSDINAYYWDTSVVAHEIGHNLGSPHTHCYVPPIDCCAVDPGCSGCVVAAPTTGTIMSYCHLQFGTGGAMLMKFHATVVALIRPLIEASPIVSPATDQPNIIIDGKEGVLAANGATEGVHYNGTLFNSMVVGGPALTQEFHIRNNGSLPLTLTGSPVVALSGSPLLSVTIQPVATVLAPGAATPFTVQYDPNIAGKHSAVLSVASSDPDSPAYTFTVTGRIVEQSLPQVFTFNGDVPIPDADLNWTIVPLQVSGLPDVITDVDVKFNGTNCGIAAQTGLEHPNVGDMEMVLLSPKGTFVFLMQLPGQPSGSGGGNFCNMILDDDPSGSTIQGISAAGAPYSDNYRPINPLSALNGETGGGTWNLYVRDLAASNAGTLHSFSLIIRSLESADVSDWSVYR